MACAEGSFLEEQFREACAELQQPALAGADWQLLAEVSGITIYRLLDQPTGLYEYKVFGVLEDCPPALLADVYMDLEYRKQWDQYVKEGSENRGDKLPLALQPSTAETTEELGRSEGVLFPCEPDNQHQGVGDRP